MHSSSCSVGSGFRFAMNSYHGWSLRHAAYRHRPVADRVAAFDTGFGVSYHIMLRVHVRRFALTLRLAWSGIGRGQNPVQYPQQGIPLRIGWHNLRVGRRLVRRARPAGAPKPNHKLGIRSTTAFLDIPIVLSPF
jgi:hypothetical protein